jgi:hypothetical protein
MSTSQKRSTTALETRLLILLRNARDLKLQLYELNKLRYQVRQAELSVRKSRRTDDEVRERLAEGQGHAPLSRPRSQRERFVPRGPFESCEQRPESPRSVQPGSVASRQRKRGNHASKATGPALTRLRKVDRTVLRTAATTISKAIDRMIADLPEYAAPHMARVRLVRELTGLQPATMRQIMDDHYTREAYEASIAEIPAMPGSTDL